MNSLRNRVTLIGHLGKDPEMTTFDSGNKKTVFTLATNDFYRNKDGETVENTEWHNIVMWGKTAEVANEYLKKGSEVAIEGKLTNRSYEDSDGNKKYFTEVVGSEVVMLGKKQKGAPQPA